MSSEDKSDKAIEQLVTQLETIGEAIKALPAEIRSQAFECFKPHLNIESGAKTKAKSKTENRDNDSDSDELDTSSLEAFFGGFDHDKPADNVTLIAAWHYSQYGLSPLSKSQINKVADDVGITVPSRPDVTLRSKSIKGKSCFRQQGRGRFTPTVHGEKFFKETYSIKKGKLLPPKEASDE